MYAHITNNAVKEGDLDSRKNIRQTCTFDMYDVKTYNSNSQHAPVERLSLSVSSVFLKVNVVYVVSI